jgi:iron complex outermembrane receptor protein
MKYIFTYIVILCCVFKLHGDNHIDTIHLNEFIYNESKIIDNQIGVNLQIFNPSLIGQTRSNTFSDFLKLNSSYYIKEYGALATPSFRGTSSSHSLILWNDIPINSFANGIIDFSSIRIDNSEQIILISGGNSSLQGSGSIGGSVHINSSIKKIKSENEISLTKEFGSFGLKSSSIKLKNNYKKLLISSSFMKLIDNNRFKYKNTAAFGSPIQTNNYGKIVHEEVKFNALYNINSYNKLQFHSWINFLDREVPQNLTTVNSDAKQYDKNYRFLLKSQHQINKLKIVLKQAFLKEDFRYTELSKNIDSKFIINTSVTDLRLKYLYHKFSFNLNSSYNRHEVTNNNYLESNFIEDNSAIFSSINFIDKLIKTNVSLRKEWNNNFNVPLLPSFAAEIKMSNYIFKLKFNKNFRAPTFNDRYWYGSNSQGNLDLKSEKANNYELSVKYQKNNITINIIGYSLYVNNWISWQENNNLWKPENIKEVWCRGIESRLNINYKNSTISANYAFSKSTSEKKTNAIDQSYKQQLRYVPLHKANVTYSFAKNQFQYFITTLYNGEVITNYGNPNNTLQDFSLFDFAIKYTFKYPLDMEIKIKNFADKQYQTYQNYPSPGRELLMTINYTFN